MTIQDFVTKYNLHDSLIDAVLYNGDANTVEMHINFAFWMQEWYTEDMDETGILKVMFNNVNLFDCPNDVPWEQISIIQATVKGDTIKFALMNDITDGYLEIMIKCNSISVN